MLYLSQSQQMTTRDLVFSALDVVRKIYTMSMLMTCSQSIFKAVSLIHLVALYMEDGGKVVIYATLPQISIHFTTLRTTRGEER